MPALNRGSKGYSSAFCSELLFSDDGSLNDGFTGKPLIYSTV